MYLSKNFAQVLIIGALSSICLAPSRPIGPLPGGGGGPGSRPGGANPFPGTIITPGPPGLGSPGALPPGPGRPNPTPPSRLPCQPAICEDIGNETLPKIIGNPCGIRCRCGTCVFEIDRFSSVKQFTGNFDNIGRCILSISALPICVQPTPASR